MLYTKARLKVIALSYFPVTLSSLKFQLSSVGPSSVTVRVCGAWRVLEGVELVGQGGLGTMHRNYIIIIICASGTLVTNAVWAAPMEIEISSSLLRLAGGIKVGVWHSVWLLPCPSWPTLPLMLLAECDPPSYPHVYT